MKRNCVVAACILILASVVGISVAQQDEEGPTTPSAAAASKLSAPSSIHEEHEHLHHQLHAALAAGGKTAVAAKEVAEILSPHFEEEEAYALPPLGLLEPLARKQHVDKDQARQAIDMADRLRRNYDVMLKEHRDLVAALRVLEQAAKDEGKPEHAQFAESLTMHAQHEEQILYPTTLVIGEYLKQQQANRSVP